MPLVDIIRNKLANDLYGMSPSEACDKGICISCKKPVYFSHYEKKEEEGNIYSDAGLSEYGISGLCEYCFDKIGVGEEEE